MKTGILKQVFLLIFPLIHFIIGVFIVVLFKETIKIAIFESSQLLKIEKKLIVTIIAIAWIAIGILLDGLLRKVLKN
jgi:hypothetical protein